MSEVHTTTEESTIRDYAQRILALVDRHVSALNSPASPENLPRHMAAAGLLRCCLLLRGILVLQDARLAFVAGILARQHWEAWLLSLYIVLRGEDAMYEVGDDDIFWKRRTGAALKLDRAYHPDWQRKPRKLNYRVLADRLPSLLRDAGETVAEGQVSGYDLTYGVQSLFTLHANLSTLGAHIEYGPEVWRVSPNPAYPFGDVAATAVLHTIHLAQYVLKAFGMSVDEVEKLGGTALAEMTKADAR